MPEEKQHFYEFGSFRLDPLKRRLTRDGEPLRLTPKAFDLLVVLVEERGRTVEKEELFRKVWPGVVVEENNLNQNITALRKSLGDSRQESQYIATVPGVGYRFVAEVSEVSSGTEGAGLDQSGDKSPHSREAPGVRGSLLGYALVVLVPLVMLALGYALYTRQRPVPVAISSIMVLPLENSSQLG